MSIFRGPILNPQSENQCDFYQDGVIIVDENGRIEAIGDYSEICKDIREDVVKVTDGIIVPAFTDTHVHMPQNHVKGKFEDQLLPWLENDIWPAESEFKNADFADEKAKAFYQEMAKQGTLSSLVFSTLHENSLHSIFRHKIGHTIAGNVLMNQNSPEYLSQTTENALDLTDQLSGKYKENYAVTPRFAPTCTMDLMRKVGMMAQERDLWIQTHLSENPGEIEWVKELFPKANSYTDVYKRAHLLTPKTVMAHCIHMSDEEYKMLADTGTRIAHCPTSNIALGSGRMPVEKVKEFGIPFALASDVGAGPSLSMLHVMQKYIEQHKEAGIIITPQEALYRATLAGAAVLNMDKVTGNLNEGKEANLCVVATSKTPTNAQEAIEDMTDGSIEELESKVQEVYFRGKKI